MEESGTYTYGYDALSRLAEVKKDGRQLRAYEYDAFGNRTKFMEEGIQTTYTYNAANQLLSKISGTDEETFTYDKRGNLRLVMENGILKNQYTYGANNRFEQAINGNGQMSTYQYNGLGHRVGKNIGTEPLQNVEIPDPEKQIRYTIDLTRGYHNLLQTEENGETTQTYLWDGNVAAVINHTDPDSHIQDNPVHAPARNYYLQDELGSPIRLMDETGNLTETYGYDEFGQDLYGNQGIIQPFGYTGYQADPVAGTCFAQAREYRLKEGRFGGEDIIKGTIVAPYTLNQYGYCWNNPMVLVDLSGELAQWIEDAWSDVKNWWNTYVYGEKVTTQNSGGELYGMCYPYYTWEDSFTAESDIYTGSFIVKETIISDEGTDIKYSINLPTYDLGNGKSVGIPASLGASGGNSGIHISASIGLDLIAPKVSVNADVGLSLKEILSAKVMLMWDGLMTRLG